MENASKNEADLAIHAIERLQCELKTANAKAEGLNRENSRARNGISMVFEVVRDAVVNRPVQDQTISTDIRGRGVFDSDYTVVKTVFDGLRVDRYLDKTSDIPLAAAFMWGNAMNVSNMFSMGVALSNNVPLILCEDGFLKSADTWCNRSADPKYTLGCSLVFDTRTCYYDATKPSTIELMLNDRNLVVSDAEKAEARRLINRIVSNRLTKYNHQPIFEPKVGRPGHRKVLVVDQSYGDFAIRRGWADDSTFEKMLASAISENPDADILVKTHPDTMTGVRKGYYDNLQEHDNVFRVTMPINPYSLMDVVDKVYVCSTQFGFEALMAGKEVHVFGMPFYAGWGITIDDQKNPRRTNTRTLEEVFHIFYILYTHWIDPVKNRRCTIDESIDHLIRLRGEYNRVRGLDAAGCLPPPAGTDRASISAEDVVALYNGGDKLGLVKTLIAEYNTRQLECVDLVRKSGIFSRVVKKDVKHVGIYYFKLTVGGTERIVQYIAEQLHRRGYKVTVILEEAYSEECFPLSRGIDVAFIPRSTGPSAATSALHAETLARVLQEREIDVLYSHMFSTSNILWDILVCNWVVRIPFVLHYHSTFTNTLHFTPPPEWFGVRAGVLSLCNQVVALSRVDSLYFNASGVAAKYLPNPITEELIAVARDGHLLDRQEEKVVLWVGRLCEMKRPVEAVRIFALLHGEDPQTRLVMVGGGSDAIVESIKKVAAECGVAEKLTLVGNVKNTYEYYATASVFLATSSFEGFPMSSQEALCYGVPIVAYEIPHVELYRGNRAVTQVPQRDIVAAAKALYDVLSSPDYLSIRQSARDFMQKYCDFDFVGEIEKLLDGHGESDTDMADMVSGEDVAIAIKLIQYGVSETCLSTNRKMSDMRRSLKNAVDASKTNTAELASQRKRISALEAAVSSRDVALKNEQRKTQNVSRERDLLKKTSGRREVELRNEVAALKNSESYRFGLVVTWPLRKVYRGIKCWRENGIKYTAKRIVAKTKNFFRHGNRGK